MDIKPDEYYQELNISAGDGLVLYVRDYPAKTEELGVILCLGGLARNSKDFHQLASRVSSRYRVISPDYRGRGRSAYDPDWRHYQPRTYLDDIRHLMTALGVHRFVAIGTSLGGVLGMALGTAMPGSLCGVLLNDVGPVISTTDIEPILAYMRDTPPLPDWDDAVEHLKKTFPHLPADTYEDWLRIAKATFRVNSQGLLIFDWDPAIAKPLERQDISEIDLWPYYRSIRQQPVLAVRGALSPFMGDDLWRKMKTALPDLRQVTVEGVGHAPSLCETEVISEIEQWLGHCFVATA